MRILFSLIILFSVLPNIGNAYISINDTFNKSYALVIGIDKYPSSKWQNLSYAVADAKAMGKFLENQGFIVSALYDEKATRDAIVDELEGNIGQILGPNDRFVIFFAGHGHTESFSGNTERGYIVPYDGKDRTSTFLPMAQLRDISNILDIARHQLFIMDTCYGGRLGSRGEMDHLDPKLPQYLEEIVKRKARQILTAGGATQRVLDSGSDGHSVFTSALLEALNKGFGDTDGDGIISFYELAFYMQRAANRTNQSPAIDYLDGHGQGEFVFANPVWVGKQNDSQPAGSQGGITRGESVYEIMKKGVERLANKDLSGSKPFFEEAASLGNIDAKLYLGSILFKEGKEVEGLILIEDAADHGHLVAMETLRDLFNSFKYFDKNKADYWETEIANAKALTDITRLVDLGGKERTAESSVPKEAVRIAPPSNLRIITY